MTSYLTYQGIFYILPFLLAVLSGIMTLIVGYCFLTPDKLVRTIFPYIKRKGDNTVAFGFILSKSNIRRETFWWMVVAVFTITIIFCNQIFIIQNSYDTNPYLASDCFYTSNHNLVMKEAPEEDITCFAINLNLGGAVGHVTGVLALCWVVMSIVTWILLNLIYKFKKSCRHFTCILTNIDILVRIMIVLFSIYHLHYLFTPEYHLFYIIVFASATIIDSDIKKAPKSLEEHCREVMKQKTREECERIKRKYMKSVVEVECTRIIIDEAIAINEEETKIIADI